jgi:hypothetical protein
MSDASQKSSDEKVWKRRGLIAAGGALVAAVVARFTQQEMAAANGDPVLLGTANQATNPTLLSGSTPFVFGAESKDQWAILGTGYVGVQGHTPGTAQPSDVRNGAGIFGVSDRADSYGVVGVNASGGIGVRGVCQNGVAVQGDASNGGIGLYGNGRGIAAVYGRNDSNGFGVYGLSVEGSGVAGATAAAGGAAVVGATNGIPGAYAGIFYGPVVVDGAFTVVGGPKSAAVPHPDGSHRRLYCVESPESWFEDFGKGQLEGGCASVAVDPDFATVVDLTDYHVFLTGYDGERDLTVTNRTLAGFRVESSRTDSHGTFSWRLVAKRKDIAAPRFEAVTVPPAPVLPSIPDMPPPTRGRGIVVGNLQSN